MEIVRFDVIKFATGDAANPRLPARYAAWLIPSHGMGEVQLFDLGDAQAIDDEVGRIRQAIGAAAGSKDAKSTIFEYGEPEAERIARESLQKLAARILTPLAPHLKPFARSRHQP